MPFQAVCPHCDHAYTLADTAAGKKVRCKECKEVFDAVAARPARSRPAAARARPAPEAEEVEPRPRKRGARKARRGMPLWGWLLIGGGGLALLGVVGVVALLLFLPGSGFSLTNRVTPENFDKLKVGMTEAELVEILGPPSERYDNFADYIEQNSGLPGMGMKLTPLERQMFAGLGLLRWTRGSDYIEVAMQDGSAVRFTGHFEGVGTYSHGIGNIGPRR